ncbi:MAG: murein transglycosylase A [Alphaproteobacteria bacterium]
MKKIVCTLLFSALLFSCEKKEQEQPQIPETPLPQQETPKELELKQVSFNDLQNWNNDNFQEIVKAFKASCARIKNEKNRFLSNSLIQIPTINYQKTCNLFEKENPQKNAEIKGFFEKNFTPYAIYQNGDNKGKFTSYYESALNASYTQNNVYKYPVYGKPADLIEINLKDFDNELPAKRLVGRIQNNKLIPYYTRKEIENTKINAPVLLWADSHIDIYVMQIQGSAVAYMPDGSRVRIGYADNNGHPFRGIGSILLEKGLIKPGEASMGKIKQWLAKNDKLAKENMAENKRYVFHRLVEADGPIGAQGVPLTAGRSLAVDKKFIPLGALLWLETTGPDQEKIEKMVIAQDIGGAIKGAVRGDYFWGSGKDDILEKAGKMNSSGQYFILIPNNSENNR